MKLWIPAAVCFLVAGTLEVMFLALSLLGTLMGGAFTALAIAGEVQGEDAIMGPVLLVFYGIWFLATVIAGPLHLVAGGAILAGNRNKKLLWAATVASLLPLITVYCALPSSLAGVVGLLCAVLPDPDEQPAAG